MRISDYIFNYIKNELGIEHIFMLPGGGAMHLVDALGHSGIDYVCCGHEQAVAISAESYGQHTNNIGVAMVTSGPGSTNAITGVTAGWIDSTPMLIISGQAKRTDLIGNSGVRQMGSQEVPIIGMVKPITKYAVQVLDPEEIRYHLEKACHLARSGRKGPVWLDIPLDVQGFEIEPYKLSGYTCDESSDQDMILENQVEAIIELIKNSNKPLILAGNGVLLSKSENLLISVVEKTGIPIQTTWKAAEIIGEEEPYYAGHPGIMGDRGANFILQECDLLLVFGSRLDNSITAYNQENFAKNAKKVIVDIDPSEMDKHTMTIDIPITGDVQEVLERLSDKLDDTIDLKRNSFTHWLDSCKSKRLKYDVGDSLKKSSKSPVSAYKFIEILSDLMDENDVIVPESSGGAGEITYQAIKIKKGQRIKNAAGLGSMGFGLPYSIGACLANGKKRTVLINGDGAFMLNVQELETLKRLNLPVKIFIWSNEGYGSIRSMQNNAFSGHYVASDDSSGMSIPSIDRIAEGFGIKTFKVDHVDRLEEVINHTLKYEGPSLCVVEVLRDETVSPRAKSTRLGNGKMISSKLENMWPYLTE